MKIEVNLDSEFAIQNSDRSVILVSKLSPIQRMERLWIQNRVLIKIPLEQHEMLAAKQKAWDEQVASRLYKLSQY